MEPTGERSKAGTLGWAVLGGFVLGWDLFAPETLSSAVDRALETRMGKVASTAGVLVVGAHLLNVFDNLGVPDPITSGFDVLAKVRSVTAVEEPLALET